MSRGAKTGAAPGPLEPALGETHVERLARLLSEAALVGMVLLVGAEVMTRSLFDSSLDVADEIGGYLLAALTFLSLSVALVNKAFHQVEYVYARITPRGRALSSTFFTVLSLAFALILEWQLGRLVMRSHATEIVAPTLLGTPLWIPQSAMLIGTTFLLYALLRALRRDVGALVATFTPGGSR